MDRSIFYGARGMNQSSSWTPLKPLGGETPSFWVKENSRSGLTLTDSVNVANNATIRPSCLDTTGITGYGYINDNGGLDIYESNFTLFGWINNTLADKTAIRGFMGKMVFGSANGRFGIYSLATSGYFRCTVESSGGTKDITSSIDSTTAGWVFLLMDVNVTTKIIRFFINNIQIGVDTSYTGTFSNLSNSYRFYIGAMNTATTGAATLLAQAKYADIATLNRILTPSEMASCMIGVYPTDCKAHYPCNSFNLTDVSGNGYHLTGSGISASTISFDTKGSQHCLNKGYSLYRKQTEFESRLYVPFLDSGLEMGSPNVPVGYIKESSHDGDALNHNLADSLILFSNDEFDRSNTTMYNSLAREGFYNVAIPKAWHPLEMNKTIMNSFCNAGYLGRTFVKVTNNSVDDRRKLLEIFSYVSNKWNSDYSKVQKYTGDEGHSYYIDYYFETDYISTQRGNKVLYFLSNRYLSLSLDGGATIINTIDLNGIASLIVDSYIYENGNISFCSDTKHYYSDDNLATYQESTTIGADGGVYVPSASENFKPLTLIKPAYISGKEIRVWGAYANTAGIEGVNVNAWYSIDGGVTVKSFYKVAYTDPVKAFRHIHGIYFDGTSFYIYTGDGIAAANDCLIIKCDYDWDLDSWSKSVLVTGNGTAFFKATGIQIKDGYIHLISDSDTVAKRGVWKALLSDIANEASYTQVFNTSMQIQCSFLDGANVLMSKNQTPEMFISVDYMQNIFRQLIIGGPTVNPSYGAYYAITDKNTNGYYKCEIYDNTESLYVWTKGTVLMIKIVI